LKETNKPLKCKREIKENFAKRFSSSKEYATERKSLDQRALLIFLGGQCREIAHEHLAPVALFAYFYRILLAPSGMGGKKKIGVFFFSSSRYSPSSEDNARGGGNVRARVIQLLHLGRYS